MGISADASEIMAAYRFGVNNGRSRQIRLKTSQGLRDRIPDNTKNLKDKKNEDGHY